MSNLEEKEEKEILVFLLGYIDERFRLYPEKKTLIKELAAKRGDLLNKIEAHSRERKVSLSGERLESLVDAACTAYIKNRTRIKRDKNSAPTIVLDKKNKMAPCQITKTKQGDIKIECNKNKKKISFWAKCPSGNKLNYGVDKKKVTLRCEKIEKPK